MENITETEDLRSSVCNAVNNATFGIFPQEATLAAMCRWSSEMWDDFMGFVLLEFLSVYVLLPKNTKQRADLQNLLYIFLNSYTQVAQESINEFMQKTAQTPNGQCTKLFYAPAITSQDTVAISYVLSTHFKFAWLFARLQEEQCVQDETFLQHQVALVHLEKRVLLAKSRLSLVLQGRTEKT